MKRHQEKLMQLYDMQMAPNPRRVRVLLAEKGIKNVQSIHVDIAKREHKSDDYVANINHMGQVPTLELNDGGTANWMGGS